MSCQCLPTARPFKDLSWESQRPHYQWGHFPSSNIFFMFSLILMPCSFLLLFLFLLSPMEVFHPMLWPPAPTRPSHWPYTFLNNQTKGISSLEMSPAIHVPPLWIPFPSFVLHFFFFGLMLLLLTVLFPLPYAPMGTRDTYTFASSQ